MTKFASSVAFLFVVGLLSACTGCTVPKADYDALKARTDDLQGRVYSLEASLAVANKRLADADAAGRAEKESLQEQLRAARTETDSLRRQLDQATADRAKAAVEARKVRQANQDLKEQMASHVESLVQFKAKLADLENRIRELQGKLQEQKPPPAPPDETRPSPGKRTP